MATNENIPYSIFSMDTKVLLFTVVTGNDDERKLFAGEFPEDATEAQIKEHFGQFGEVETVTLITNMATGRSNSFCSIVYRSVDSLETAVAAEHTISNKRVFVEKAPVFGLRHSGARNSENLVAPVDTSLEIIGEVKPRHERTWEIIDLSLEEIEAGSDDQNHLSDTSF